MACSSLRQVLRPDPGGAACCTATRADHLAAAHDEAPRAAHSGALDFCKKICTQPKRTCTYTRTHTNHTFTVSHTCTLWKFYFLMTFFVAGISGRAIEELRAVRAEGAASGQVRLCHRAQAPLYAIAITRSHLCYTYLIYHPLVDSFLFS